MPKRSNGAFFPTPAFAAAPYSGYVSFFTAPSAKDSTVPNLATGFSAYEWGEGQIHGPLYAPTSGPSIGYVPATVGAAYYYIYAGCADAQVRRAALHAARHQRVGGGQRSGRRLLDARRHDRRKCGTAAEFRDLVLVLSHAPEPDQERGEPGFRAARLEQARRLHRVEPKDNPADALINPARYLSIDDFTTVAGGQKEKWYRKLFSQVPRGASPAREGLARVGRYYGGKTDGINAGMDGPDPVQNACQQNFTILTTDGYWNGQTQTPGGGGVMLDGTTWSASRTASLSARKRPVLPSSDV